MGSKKFCDFCKSETQVVTIECSHIEAKQVDVCWAHLKVMGLAERFGLKEYKDGHIDKAE